MRLRLTQPTDFLILDTLLDGRRNVASNIAEEIGKKRKYINTRLPVLADYGLVERIGPAENSGLYQITSLGVAAVRHQSVYDRDRDEFKRVIENTAGDITIIQPDIQTQN